MVSWYTTDKVDSFGELCMAEGAMAESGMAEKYGGKSWRKPQKSYGGRRSGIHEGHGGIPMGQRVGYCPGAQNEFVDLLSRTKFEEKDGVSKDISAGKTF